jgi:hypothetical protein
MKTVRQTIVITGASGGLGRAIALRLSRDNPDLVLVARTEAPLRQLAEGIRRRTGLRPMVHVCDVSDEEDVRRLAEAVIRRHPRVDVLVNNAGIAVYQPSLTLSAKDMRRQFEVNVFGAFYLTQALLPALARSDAGYVLNVGSLFGRVALPGNSIYAATKFALAGYTQGLRLELRRSGIRVGLLNPGPMNTNLHAAGDGPHVPAALTTDVDVMARHAVSAIRRRAAVRTRPYWTLVLIRLARWLGRGPAAPPDLPAYARIQPRLTATTKSTART